LLLDLDDIKATEMIFFNPVRKTKQEKQSPDLHQEGKTIMFPYFDIYTLK
jgi:hypothetical protein